MSTEYYKYKTVECGSCERRFQLRLGPVELFGSEIWYADEDDPESQLIIRDDEVTCYDCMARELDLEDF